MRVALVKYGVGNIYSISSSLRKIGFSVDVLDEPSMLRKAVFYDLLVLPGMGAYPAAMRFLDPVKHYIFDALESGTFLFGICLGMQLFYEGSWENNTWTRGLGLLPGVVDELYSRKKPHIAWTSVKPLGLCPLLEEEDYFYFAHGYVVRPREKTHICAISTYNGDTFPAIVWRPPIAGTQFHPEKSGEAGLKLLSRLKMYLRGRF